MWLTPLDHTQGIEPDRSGDVQKLDQIQSTTTLAHTTQREQGAGDTIRPQLLSPKHAQHRDPGLQALQLLPILKNDNRSGRTTTDRAKHVRASIP